MPRLPVCCRMPADISLDDIHIPQFEQELFDRAEVATLAALRAHGYTGRSQTRGDEWSIRLSPTACRIAASSASKSSSCCPRGEDSGTPNPTEIRPAPAAAAPGPTAAPRRTGRTTRHAITI